MTVQDLIKETGWKTLVPTKKDAAIRSVFIGDLLSYVMGNAESSQAWITMQTHQNVIAIAALKDFACVILIDDLYPDPDALESALENGIPILVSPLDAYQSAKVLMQLGL